jgi:hypothetical protein
METAFKKHAETYARVYAHELDLNPKHPIFPPDYLEDEKLIFLNPQPTYVRVSSKDYSMVEVDITDGNAPCQVNFMFENGEVEKDFVWIGENKAIKIPYRDNGHCDVYFLRKLNKGFCKGNYKFSK